MLVEVVLTLARPDHYRPAVVLDHRGGRPFDPFADVLGIAVAAGFDEVVQDEEVGAHYLPFITLYGMKMFGVLAGLLVLTGAALALYGPAVFSLGGWITGVLLILFAFAGRRFVLKEEQQSDMSAD